MIRLNLLAILVALGGGAVPSVRGQATAPDVRVCSGEGVTWIYSQHRRDDDYRLSFVVRTPDLKEFVGPTRLRDLATRVRAAAMVGDDLHVFYGESHRRYRVRDQRLRMNTESMLPESGQPVMLASAPRGKRLVAIVDRRTADAIHADRWAQAVALAESEEGALPRLDPPPVDLGNAAFAVAEYQGAGWIVSAPLPADIVPTAEGLMLAEPEALWIALADASAQRLRVHHHRGLTWSSDDRPMPERFTPLALVHSDDRVGVVGAAGGRDVLDIRVLWPDAEIQQVAFSPKATRMLEPPFVVAAGPRGLGAAIALIDGQSRVVQADWSPGDSEPLILSEVWALRRTPPVLLDAQVQSILAFAVLAGLMALAFWRCHDSITRELELPAQYRVAGYWRRFAGFMLDALPVAYLTRSMWKQRFEEWFIEYQALDAMDAGQLPLSEAVLSGVLKATLVYAAFCLVSELAFGSTPGKLAVRCRVVAEDGHRCRPRAIIIRNLLRIVELFPLFQAFPPFVLILFTRNRQRLGDLLGRTLIVEYGDAARERTHSVAESGSAPP